ncbi:PadR family transcriptional regulator [Neobacillus muris]|uniref:PadR family transcriptional regulator n=1 Tax=Neobacillus muris TaxID=2941334 RepID=UPI00203CDEDF|nr:PadR family transcriptional regulator [Neobacillus muris]
MDKRLKNLKNALKNTVLNDLDFTEGMKNNIRNQIMGREKSSDDAILFAVLQLLVQQKTGFELSRLIRARGIERFEQEEGFLYMLLHRLEQKGYIQSSWADEEVKYYQLNSKGRKLLGKGEENEYQGRTVLHELLEGGWG